MLMHYILHCSEIPGVQSLMSGRVGAEATAFASDILLPVTLETHS